MKTWMWLPFAIGISGCCDVRSEPGACSFLPPSAPDEAGEDTLWFPAATGIGPPNDPFVDLTPSCGLRSSGKITCWAGDSPPTGDWIDVAAVGDFHCGLGQQGRLSCWGPPPFFDPGTDVDTPYTRIVLGGHGYCGADAAGTWSCQGEPELRGSNPDTVVLDDGLNSCPLSFDGVADCGPGVSVPQAIRFTDLDLGTSDRDDNACGVRDDGVVQCFAPGAARPPIGSFVQVDVADEIACAVLRAGGVVCWGPWGATGPGVTDAPADGDFTHVVVGDEHACALSMSREIACWGDP